MVALRADGPDSATLVRLMSVQSGRCVLRVAHPGFPDIVVTRANGTMGPAVAVFVGRSLLPPHQHDLCGGPTPIERRGFDGGARLQLTRMSLHESPGPDRPDTNFRWATELRSS